MIVYFSATGNSKYIAEVIANRTNDKAISILDINGKITLNDNEDLGIITPTYCWRLPTIVEEFLKGLEVENVKDNYICYIATFGETSGQTDYYVKQYLRKKKIKLSASFGIKTVDNWVVDFNLNDKNQVEKILNEEAFQINAVIDKIINKECEFINKYKKPLFLCWGAKMYYNSARKTKRFKVDNNCVGCGICEKNCPIKAIKMVEQKPSWAVNKCTLCFGCLHNCPKNAIEYNGITKKNGQYHHPDFKK